jgi:hypothetical protein
VERLVVDEYRFVIDALTPETLSLGRLVTYLEALKHLMGDEPGLHFLSVDPGSAQLKMIADAPINEKLRSRITGIETGEAPAEALKAKDTLNNLLRQDDSIADLNVNGSNVLQFSGRDAPAPARIGPVIQRTSIEGMLIKIGGKNDKTVPFTLMDGERVWKGETNRLIARQVAPYLFDRTLRFTGDGKWSREADGYWKLEHFCPDGFEILDDAPLDQAITQLQANTTFLPDALEIIRDLREEGDLI